MGAAAGLTAAGVKGLHVAAERHVGDEQVPGLVALVARGDEVHVEALGRLTVGGPPVAHDSIFRIASTTKPITAAVTLAVAAEGLIGLDEPVDRLLPELAGRKVLRRMDGPLDDTVPAARAITARDLLTFTFGFGMVGEMFASPQPWPVVAAAGELRLATFGPPDPPVPPDPDTWIAALGSLPLLAQPGERWMYNTGAQVLGVLVARRPGSRSATCSRPGSSARSACATPVSGLRIPGVWPPPTSPPRTGWRCSMSPMASGAARRGSVTGRPAWYPPLMTCSRSPGCCCAAGRRCCQHRRCGP